MSTEYDILAGTGIKVEGIFDPNSAAKHDDPDFEEIAEKADGRVFESYDGRTVTCEEAQTALDKRAALIEKAFADDGRVWQETARRKEAEPVPEPEMLQVGPMPPFVVIGDAVFSKDPVGAITGIDAMQAGAQAPLTEFVMARPPRGGWVIFNHRYGNPLAAFSTFDEACAWLKGRVAK